MNVFENSNLTREFLEKNMKYTNAYKNYKKYHDIDLEELSEEMQRKHDVNYDYTLRKDSNDLVHKIESSDESGAETDTESGEDTPDNPFENIYKRIQKADTKIINMKSVNKSARTALGFNRKYLKLKICFGFLKAAGFDYISQEEHVKLNWEKLRKYCQENEPVIRTLFESSLVKFEGVIDENLKKTIMNYINQKLSPLLGVIISRDYKGSSKHIIKTRFKI